MAERYIVDFTVGQAFGPGRMRIQSEVLEVRPPKSQSE